MVKKSKDERRAERAVDDVEKGLARCDVELAIGGIQRASAAARLELLPRVRAMFRSEVHCLQARGDWVGLRAAIRSATAVPELVGVSTDEVDAGDVRWALFWGAIRSGERRAAGAFLAEFKECLRERAPALLSALETRTAAELMEPACIDAALAEVGLAAGDLQESRLGYEPTRVVKREIPRPSSVEEVEAATIQLLAGRRWSEFADGVITWLGEVDGAVARLLALTASGLATRELLLRLRNRAAALEPSLLIAKIVKHRCAPAELERDVLIAYRAMGSALRSGQVADAGTAEAMAALAGAAALYPQHRSWIQESLVGTPVVAQACGPVLDLLRTWLEEFPSFELAIKAFRLSTLARVQGEPLPGWIEEALARVVEYQTTARAEGPRSALQARGGPGGELVSPLIGRSGIGEWLARVDERLATEVLLGLARSMRPVLVERILDAAWTAAGDAHLVALTRAFEITFDRLWNEQLKPRNGWRSLLQRDLFFDALDLFAQTGSPMAVLAEVMMSSLPGGEQQELMALVRERLGSDSVKSLPPSVATVLSLWSARVLSHSPKLLTTLLECSREPRDGMAWVARYLEGKSDIDSRLDVLVRIPHWLDGMREALLEETLTLFASDVDALAKAFAALDEHASPRELLDIARAMDAADLAAPGPRTGQTAARLAEARRRLDRGRKKTPRTKKATTKAKPESRGRRRGKGKSPDPLVPLDLTAPPGDQ